jgi:hypothetical protein
MTDRDCVKPQSQLRQLDRHRVQVYSKNAGFDDPPLPVGKARIIARCSREILVPGVRVSGDLLGKILAGPH